MEKDIYSYLHDIFQNSTNTTVFELGAHQGMDTEKLLNIFNNSKYYAFEPDPRNIAILKSKGIDKKVNLIESAIGDKEYITTLYQSSGTPPYRPDGFVHTASSSIRKPKNACDIFPWLQFNSEAVVNVTSLDSFCKLNNIEHIDFIWADIQGAERDLIAGGQSSLENTKYLYTEYSNDEIYEGEYDLNTIISSLPTKWKVIDVFERDVLLKNTNLGSK